MARSKEQLREEARVRQAAYRARYPDRYKESKRKCNLNAKYGVSAEEYARLEVAQAGLCAVCHRPETKPNIQTGKPSRLSVDHDHDTGRVRGLLCAACNLGLGNFGDNTDRLRSAALYLESSVV